MEEFAKKFIVHFTSSKKPNKTTISVLRFMQCNGEFLREFISRFNLKALEIANLTISNTVQALLKGMMEGLLQLSLSKKAPRDMLDLLSRAEKYINF